MKQGYTRWWRNIDGKLERRSTYDGAPPGPGWQQGFPLSEQAREQRRLLLSSIRRGVVTSEATKELMRQAKLGTRQSPEHRQARSLAAKVYAERVHVLMEQQGISWNEARRQLKNKGINI